jgi:hypothetical protein
MNLGSTCCVVVALHKVLQHRRLSKETSVIQFNTVGHVQPHTNICLGSLKKPLGVHDAATIAAGMFHR